MNRYKIIRKLGQGQFGKVYRADDTKRSQKVALKIIKGWIKLDPFIKEMVQFERDILCKLEHPNILKLYKSFIEDNNLIMVYEYCNSGDLCDMISESALPENEVLEIIKCLASALSYLADQSIIHRDIKPENIFFNRDSVKLGDFGFSTRGCHIVDSAYIGSMAFQAPEIHSKMEYSPLTDVYSLGMTMYEMLMGKLPFKQEDADDLPRLKDELIVRDESPAGNISIKTLHLLSSMLSTQKYSRPSASDIVEAIDTILEPPTLSKQSPKLCKQQSSKKKRSLVSASQGSILFQPKQSILKNNQRRRQSIQKNIGKTDTTANVSATTKKVAKRNRHTDQRKLKQVKRKQPSKATNNSITNNSKIEEVLKHQYTDLKKTSMTNIISKSSRKNQPKNSLGFVPFNTKDIEEGNSMFTQIFNKPRLSSKPQNPRNQYQQRPTPRGAPLKKTSLGQGDLNSYLKKYKSFEEFSNIKGISNKMKKTIRDKKKITITGEYKLDSKRKSGTTTAKAKSNVKGSYRELKSKKQTFQNVAGIESNKNSILSRNETDVLKRKKNNQIKGIMNKYFKSPENGYALKYSSGSFIKNKGKNKEAPVKLKTNLKKNIASRLIKSPGQKDNSPVTKTVFEKPRPSPYQSIKKNLTYLSPQKVKKRLESKSSKNLGLQERISYGGSNRLSYNRRLNQRSYGGRDEYLNKHGAISRNQDRNSNRPFKMVAENKDSLVIKRNKSQGSKILTRFSGKLKEDKISIEIQHNIRVKLRGFSSKDLQNL